MRAIILFLAAVTAASARTVSLSNTQLPKDTAGKLLLTGEADVLAHGGKYYLYMNDWGGCRGVNCCDSSGGCAACCFAGPHDPCVYTVNHTVNVYETSDFTAWTKLGAALPRAGRLDGIVFRPHVVFNNKTKLFVMWYENRFVPGVSPPPDWGSGYHVAVSATPAGPFKTIAQNVQLAGGGKLGDFDILVDDVDGTAYLVHGTGVPHTYVVQLNDTYTGGAGPDAYTTFTTPKPSEGPVFFQRQGMYYILPGTGCCACKGGSSIYVLTAPHPMGPWQYHGDIGSVPGHTFDPHSPHNYVTNAQASAVFRVGDQYVWLGNQWTTSEDGMRDHDKLYWTTLPFDDAHGGVIEQLAWHDTCELELDENQSLLMMNDE